jgi:hypothetical protein
MRLRERLDKEEPVEDGEIATSPGARKLIYRGSYFFSTQITGVRAVMNQGPRNNEKFPYKVAITRKEKGGKERVSGVGRFSPVYTELPPAIHEFKDERALARASHVEESARRVKQITAITFLALTGMATALYAVNNLDNPIGTPQPSVSATLEPCANILPAGETLNPVQESQVANIRHLGGIVCTKGTSDYQVIPIPTTTP